MSLKNRKQRGFYHLQSKRHTKIIHHNLVNKIKSNLNIEQFPSFHLRKMINDTEEVCLLENWTLDISINDKNSDPIQIQDPFESVWMKVIAILCYFIGLVNSAILLAFINYEKEHHGNFRTVINQLLSNMYAMVS